MTPVHLESLASLAEIAEECADDGAGARLCVSIVNKHTDERRDFPGRFDPAEMAFQIREALRCAAQVDALVALGRAIVQRETA